MQNRVEGKFQIPTSKSISNLNLHNQHQIYNATYRLRVVILISLLFQTMIKDVCNVSKNIKNKQTKQMKNPKP